MVTSLYQKIGIKIITFLAIIFKIHIGFYRCRKCKSHNLLGLHSKPKKGIIKRDYMCQRCGYKHNWEEKNVRIYEFVKPYGWSITEEMLN